MLIALAAVKAGAVDGPSIQAQMASVSGANGGTKCTGFKECADLLAKGTEIDYQPVSGVGPFNSANDPSSAYIGVFKYDDNNVNQYFTSVFGKVPTS